MPDDGASRQTYPPKCIACRQAMTVWKETAEAVMYRCQSCGMYHAATREEIAATEKQKNEETDDSRPSD